MRRGAGQTGTYLVMRLNDYKSDVRKHEMLTRNPPPSHLGAQAAGGEAPAGAPLVAPVAATPRG
jgi:hypothetical protein